MDRSKDLGRGFVDMVRRVQLQGLTFPQIQLHANQPCRVFGAAPAAEPRSRSIGEGHIQRRPGQNGNTSSSATIAPSTGFSLSSNDRPVAGNVLRKSLQLFGPVVNLGQADDVKSLALISKPTHHRIGPRGDVGKANGDRLLGLAGGAKSPSTMWWLVLPLRAGSIFQPLDCALKGKGPVAYLCITDRGGLLFVPPI